MSSTQVRAYNMQFSLGPTTHELMKLIFAIFTFQEWWALYALS